eukprot:TRINITY_DN6437_c1_g1_i1.p1 TRINITY_DN6437_c1_g1~~TRINITY_DN6437_c1_g1_i1.p1  ORF type:complete len:281 (-),score=85.84 TRINITY_DN6437_c1_g1_i1:123-965(-)
MKGEEGLKQLEEAEKSGGGAGPPVRHVLRGRRGPDPWVQHESGDEGGSRGHLQRPHPRVHDQEAEAVPGVQGTGANGEVRPRQVHQVQGTGSVVQRMQLAPGFVQQVQAQCPVCGGKGTTVKAKCPVCGGARVKRGDAKLELLIEQGMPEGHAVTFEMEADESPDVIPGDVIVTLTTHPHPLFKRSGDDLAMSMRISLLESLVGFRRTFEHLDRRVVEVASAPGAVTPHGHAMVLPGEGMPRHHVPSEMGSLTITFEVVFPTTITPEQAEGFRRVLGTAA